MSSSPLLARGAVLACAAGLGLACAVGPDYAPPGEPLPPAWSSALESGVSGVDPDPARLAGWWRNLGDPLLGELAERALLANPTLLEAQARVRQARAERRAARAALLPSLEGRASSQQSHSGSQAGGSFSGEPTGGGDRSLYQVGVDAIWELDVFGGLRRGAEAAEAGLAASEADLGDVQVSLLAELALEYVGLRALQGRLAAGEENLALQQETAQMAEWRAEAGLTTALDVEQARASLEQTRADLPLLRRCIAQSQRRIAVLVGEPPGALDAQLDPPAAIPLPPSEVAVGVPAALLLRRPDLRRAERQLAAESARVGVATARAYPSISLIGSLGLDALDGEELFAAGAGSSAFTANLAHVIFDFGRIRAQIDAQDALREQALVRFRAALLVALEEVEDALVSYAREQERAGALSAAAGAAGRAAELSRARYASGLVDFEAVVLAERSMISLRDQLLSSQGEVTSNLIRLYKALGGGWNPPGSGG